MCYLLPETFSLSSQEVYHFLCFTTHHGTRAGFILPFIMTATCYMSLPGHELPETPLSLLSLWCRAPAVENQGMKEGGCIF